MKSIREWLQWSVDGGYIQSWTDNIIPGVYYVRDNNGEVHSKTKEEITAMGGDFPMKWIFIVYMRASNLPKAPKAKHQSKKVYNSKEEEKADIQRELDIYRGVVETPKNYKSDPTRVKQLMRRLKEL